MHFADILSDNCGLCRSSWLVIIVGSHASSDPHGWGMLLLRVGATVILLIVRNVYR